MSTPLLRWLPWAVAQVPATVHTKLLVAFLAIVGLLFAIGVVSLAELGRLNERAEDFVKLQRKIAAYRQIQHSTTSQLYSVATAMLAPGLPRSTRHCASSTSSATTSTACSSSRRTKSSCCSGCASSTKGSPPRWAR